MTPTATALPPPLVGLLEQTSRTFYRTLQILPRAVRPQISLAYLLARTTDTIADTEIIPLEARLAALQHLRGRILGTSEGPLDLGELARHQAQPAERGLLGQCEASLAVLRELSPADAALVREVLITITSGQELDLQRFHGASVDKVVSLQTDNELDDYTYRVAGCVGEFWTKICHAHLFPEAHLDERLFLADAVRFGKGLQLVNILRDLPADLRTGRCYLPLEELTAAGLKPADLLQPAMPATFRPLYHRYLELAESHLAAGWRYTNLIPPGQIRVRLACALPILIGLETLKRLRTENVLDPKQRVKISRAQVRQLFLCSVLYYPWQAAWRRLAGRAASPEGKPVASSGDLT
jgi:farnesyl-diphosphate farnesyltransferase